MKTKIEKEDVLNNMKDVLVRTEQEFGHPVTYVTVRMENGFTLRESTTCVDPKNYSEEKGKEICLEKIEDRIWFLLGYKLTDDLYKKMIEDAEKPKGLAVRMELDYVTGHLRYGHFDALIPEDKIEAFKNADKYEKEEMIREYGDLEIDDYRVDDFECGSIEAFEKVDKNEKEDMVSNIGVCRPCF